MIETTPPGLSPVATTKILAIGVVPPSADGAKVSRLIAQEVSDTLRVYLDGDIEQLFVRQDLLGVVFLMNARTVEAARSTLKGLPLAKAGLIDWDFIPLGPLMPIQALLLPPSPELNAGSELSTLATPLRN